MTFPLTIFDPRTIVRKILMLFTLSPLATNQVPKIFFNPKLKNVDITLNGMTNKVFAQDFKKDQMWTEARHYY